MMCVWVCVPAPYAEIDALRATARLWEENPALTAQTPSSWGSVRYILAEFGE